MNWKEFVNFILEEIPNAYFDTGSILGSTNFLVIDKGEKRYKICYSDSHIRQYKDNDIFKGWIWIEVFELRKGIIFSKYKSILFVRPGYHSNDVALIIPEEHVLLIKKAIVKRLEEKDMKVLGRLINENE